MCKTYSDVREQRFISGREMIAIMRNNHYDHRNWRLIVFLFILAGRCAHFAIAVNGIVFLKINHVKCFGVNFYGG